MKWFDFLKEQGYFDPKNNPEPVQVKEGFQLPLWESLRYLEKLAAEIREGKEHEYIDEILSIIKNVSENPKDNYRTWYIFIKLLGNIPNDRIPKQILNYIPVWLDSKFDTMLQSSELIENLLPKFLNENPTKDDIEKAEYILFFLLKINKK